MSETIEHSQELAEQREDHPEPQSPAQYNPMALVEMAVSKDMDISKLERLMDLAERHQKKLAEQEFFKAFNGFQSNVPTIKKKKQGHGYMYAPLGDIAKQIRATLERHQLTYRFRIDDKGDVIRVTCIVTHINGHSEETTMEGAPDDSGKKNVIQSRGSAVQYLQRYTLIAALGLTTADEDIDGRVEDPALKPITADQLTELQDLLANTDIDDEGLCKRARVNKLTEITAGRYDSITAWLRAKSVKPTENNEEAA